MTDPSLGTTSAWSNNAVRKGSMGGGGDSVVSSGGSIGGGAIAGETRQGHGGPGTAAAAAAAASPSRQADVKSRLQSNAETIAYLKKCYGEVIDSYEECKEENAAIQTQLSEINARAQTEHRNLEEARSKLEDALYVNAHLREENEMITTDDERWGFQVEQRKEQLESLTELLNKLEGQQAEIDRRKEKEEAEMVRRLEERRAEMMVRTRSSFGSGGSSGQVMSVLPKDTTTNTEMSSMLALHAPEWTPASAAGGRGGGVMAAASPATSLLEAVAIEPTAVTAPAFAVAQDGGVGHVSVGQDDAISVLTEE